jgi:hypothetical protein
MRVRLSQGTIVAAAVLLLVAVLAVLTLRLSPVARVVPGIIVVPTLVLVALSLAFEIAAARAPIYGGASNRPPTTPPAAGGEGAVLTSVLLLPVLTFALGLVAAVFGFTYVYVRRRVGWGRSRCLLVSGLLAMFVYGLARIVLGNRALRGWLWTQLGVDV